MFLCTQSNLLMTICILHVHLFCKDNHKTFCQDNLSEKKNTQNNLINYSKNFNDTQNENKYTTNQ